MTVDFKRRVRETPGVMEIGCFVTEGHSLNHTGVCLTCYESALTRLQHERDMLAQSFAMAEASEQRTQQERDTLKAALEKYGEHHRECILTRFEAGEPTTDGRYRWKYAGKWYNELPKCQCGLSAALGGTDG